MSGPGRNDPCPCSSGRKYKRCCLGKGTAGTAFSEPDRSTALAKLRDYIDQEGGTDRVGERERFFGVWEERLLEHDQHWIDTSEAAFLLWLGADVPLQGGGYFLDRLMATEAKLGSGERAYLAGLRDTAMRLYEVADLSPGVSLDLRDVLTGDRTTVHERAGSRSLWRHALLVARVIGRGPSGCPEIEPGLLPIPEIIRRSVIAQLSDHRRDHRREEPAASDLEFYKAMGPFFHHAFLHCLLDPPVPDLHNTDGDELLVTRCRFDVTDGAALAAALDRSGALERHHELEASWSWAGPNLKGDVVSLGRIVLDGGSLLLECNSVPRAERGRALIEDLAAGLVRHRSTTHENIAATVREELRSGKQPGRLSDAARAADTGTGGEEGGDALPREATEALVLDMLGRHYHGWVDEPVPALRDRTPRQAAADPALRPQLVDLIRGLEGMYERALKGGEPAYDPSWMWSDLGLEDRSAVAHPPPLCHERLASMVPGIADLVRGVAERFRQRPGFDDASTTVSVEEVHTDLEVQRFLRGAGTGTKGEGARKDVVPHLAAHVLAGINFELHRRKTFWVDGALAYMLAKTDPDVNGRDLRVPFPSFALVFTDRHVLSLAERWLASQPRGPLAGYVLRVVTAYVTEQRDAVPRVLRIGYALDALGADPPHLAVQEVPLPDDVPLERFLGGLAPRATIDPRVPDVHPVHGLLQVTLNAILYATSAGVEPELRPSPPGGHRARHPGLRGAPAAFSSESVFFLPGAIEISHVRRLQELERITSGRSLVHRFIVRGHWRRAARTWKDRRMRWIAPYWKGPDIAAVIERTYKLKP